MQWRLKGRYHVKTRSRPPKEYRFPKRNLLHPQSFALPQARISQWANLGLQAVELNQHRYLLYFQMRVGVLRYHQWWLDSKMTTTLCWPRCTMGPGAAAGAHFWPKICFFLRYDYITPIFWCQTDLTQWGHISPISWANSGYIRFFGR